MADIQLTFFYLLISSSGSLISTLMVAVTRVHLEESVADFIDYLLSDHASTTTLIVCATRSRFLEQLCACVNTNQPNSDPPLERIEPMHQLLTRSLGVISLARRVKLVFCPAVDSLRAYLSTFHIDKQGLGGTGESKRRGMLAILDLVALHYMTGEFSAQGLSRTLAIAVEAATSWDVNLMLTECIDAVNRQNLERGGRLWHMHVPLLNDAVRVGDSKHTYLGPIVSVKRIAERWFEFDTDITKGRMTGNLHETGP